MTRAMLTELGGLWDELECDGSCRAIVLTGAGTRAFTVGADITGDLSAGPEIAPMVLKIGWFSGLRWFVDSHCSSKTLACASGCLAGLCAFASAGEALLFPVLGCSRFF
jgi:enoyl-CoA hydratase/carnithine racemase